MHNLDLQVLNAGLEWVKSREIWLCTVIKTYGSSPRPTGAMMILRSDGQYSGSLSGGCVEESFIQRVKQNHFIASSQLTRYGEGGTRPTRHFLVVEVWTFWLRDYCPVMRASGISCS